MCIHGCIGGFSWAIIYLRVNSNNRATTVLSCFQQATSEWGSPFCMQDDNGGENVPVGDYMVWLRGENHGSLLTGPKVRNTRIERLWRDVVESVMCAYSSLFLFMEAQHILDPGSELDVFVLQYILLPRIQRFLTDFSNVLILILFRLNITEHPDNSGLLVVLEIITHQMLAFKMFLIMNTPMTLIYMAMILMPKLPTLTMK